MTTNYKSVSVGDVWFTFATGQDGKPTGAPMGQHLSQKEADAQAEALRQAVAGNFAIMNVKEYGFKVLDDGETWVAWYSNAAEDYEGELFPRARTDEFIGRLDRKERPMPELWGWHVAGAKHGQAEWVERIGLITVAVGKFDNSPLAKSFKEYYRNNKVELSHGFVYDEREKVGGVYGTYDTFEISTLPLGKAANPYTAFEVKEMTLTKEKLEWLNGIAGDKQTEEIVVNTVQRSKELERLGVAFKAMADGKMPPKGEEADPNEKEPDGDPDDKKKAEKKSLDLSAIESLLAASEKAHSDSLMALTTQLVGILTPIATAMNKQREEITDLRASVKGMAEIISAEYAMQPPAYKSNSTMVDPSLDPSLQLAAQAAENQGSKGYDALGPVFGSIFKGMDVAGKNLTAAPTFEFPGVQGTPQPPMTRPVPPTMPMPQQMQPQGGIQQADSFQSAMGALMANLNKS